VEGCVPGILEAICQQRPSEELYAEAGRRAAEASQPVEDQRGPVDYKRHLADELTQRVLRRAITRARATTDTLARS
jgi:carbon-monoxide dehydrogenase medium subunit